MAAVYHNQTLVHFTIISAEMNGCTIKPPLRQAASTLYEMPC